MEKGGARAPAKIKSFRLCNNAVSLVRMQKVTIVGKMLVEGREVRGWREGVDFSALFD